MTVQEAVVEMQNMSSEDLTEPRDELKKLQLIRASHESAKRWAGKTFYMDLREYLPDPLLLSSDESKVISSEIPKSFQILMEDLKNTQFQISDAELAQMPKYLEMYSPIDVIHEPGCKSLSDYLLEPSPEPEEKLE
jgi:hypothetical protein